MTKKILTLDEHPELTEVIRDLFDGSTIYGTDIKEITVEEDLVTVIINTRVHGSGVWLEGPLRLSARESSKATKDELVREGLSDLAEGKLSSLEAMLRKIVEE